MARLLPRLCLGSGLCECFTKEAILAAQGIGFFRFQAETSFACSHKKSQQLSLMASFVAGARLELASASGGYEPNSQIFS